ncbi:uncharacterized protein LOC122665828 [Telopea speciosissima]|uniref:uncharacterized protein LOC122665828 n=1 Tax=Telopea speciosissima TaxID=54955 RepID=UPI001CC71F37|nr:uncharacterized protein LOC122665828 [Telopea speciosissima]
MSRDKNSGNWWLVIGNNNEHVGYWPKDLFTYLADGAKGVSWGGLAMAGSDGVSPPMGNGRFPREPSPCFFNKLEFVNAEYYIAHPSKPADIEVRVDGNHCYDISYNDYEPDKGDSFTFGGIGGKCD